LSVAAARKSRATASERREPAALAVAKPAYIEVGKQQSM
jgi:hypothetical protein